MADAAAKRRRLDGGRGDTTETRTYKAERILGKGSFGVVYQAQVLETGEIVAIKSIRMQEKDREVQILRELEGHPNVVHLHGAFLSTEGEGREQRLNLVLDFLSDTLHRVIKHYNQIAQVMDQYHVGLYFYQMLRALAFVHGKGIVHCDVKPQNLLLDGRTQGVKLCDFGTARRVALGDVGMAYVCSRYYRAPELVLGSTYYSTSVDLWSAGCVFAEMILGQPLFAGRDGIQQLTEIIKVIGTPTPEEVKAMNSNYPACEFTPKVEAHPWDKVFKGRASPEANDIASQILCYDPLRRLPPAHALLHKCFDALRRDQRAENRFLFNFLEDEVWWLQPHEREKLVPAWYKVSST